MDVEFIRCPRSSNTRLAKLLEDSKWLVIDDVINAYNLEDIIHGLKLESCYRNS